MNAARALAWLGGSIAALVITLAPALGFGSVLESTFGGGHAARLGGAAAAWALLAASAGAFLGRALLPSSKLDRAALVGAIAGAAIAAATTQAGIVTWTEGRFGQWDPDYTSLSNLLAPTLVMLGVAVAGWLSTRSPARHTAFGLGAMSVTLVVLISVSNVRGLFNGISNVAWMLAIGVGAALAFALLVTVAYLRREACCSLVSADRLITAPCPSEDCAACLRPADHRLHIGADSVAYGRGAHTDDSRNCEFELSADLERSAD